MKRKLQKISSAAKIPARCWSSKECKFGREWSWSYSPFG